MPYEPRQPHELHPLLQKILCIAAHPDDIEFSMAGTVAQWARQGREVVFALVTSGNAGANEPNTNLSELAERRERECWDSGKILGAKDIAFLRYRDGVVEPTLDLRRDLTRLIRKHKPDVVVCGDPMQRWYGNDYLNHPDHRAVASAALDAVFPSAETRYIFPELLHEGCEPHKVRELFINFGSPPDTWVDIGETIDLKCAALKAHISQIGDGQWIDKQMREWAKQEGDGTGIEYSESYRRMIFWEPKEAEAMDQKTHETGEVPTLSHEGEAAHVR
ncbi:MAG: PIG-L family deacetylase [Chloroflexi bacterium]|nr:PIG-L family deacetylase [Chloroflexota bacterium]